MYVNYIQDVIGRERYILYVLKSYNYCKNYEFEKIEYLPIDVENSKFSIFDILTIHIKRLDNQSDITIKVDFNNPENCTLNIPLSLFTYKIEDKFVKNMKKIIKNCKCYNDKLNKFSYFINKSLGLITVFKINLENK